MEFEKITVIGSGTMGHGITQVCAQADYKVTMYDPNPEALKAGLEKIGQNLDKGIARKKVTPERKAETLSHITISSDLQEAAEGAELVIEAIPEQLALKQAVLRLNGLIEGEDVGALPAGYSFAAAAAAQPGYLAAEGLINQGRYEDALVVFREAGGEQAAHNNLGAVHLGKGEYGRALEHLERALLAGGRHTDEVLRNFRIAQEAHQCHRDGRPVTVFCDKLFGTFAEPAGREAAGDRRSP